MRCLPSTATLPPATYFLRQHVFFCRDIHYCVALDVDHDQYYCVNRRTFDALGPWLHGWEEAGECETRADGVSHLPADAHEMAAKWLSAGLLSDHPDDIKDARAIWLAPSTDELAVGYSDPTPKSHWYHFPAFFLSCMTASRQLKSPLGPIITHIRARKQRKLHSPRASDVERARPLVTAFDALRPWYPRPYRCTFDSLALLNFLAWYGVFPEWIFGVTAEPFKSHCWVRIGTTVLNDTVERTVGFTPILNI